MELTATGKTATTKNTSIISSPRVPITSETLHDLPDSLLSTYTNVPVHGEGYIDTNQVAGYPVTSILSRHGMDFIFLVCFLSALPTVPSDCVCGLCVRRGADNGIIRFVSYDAMQSMETIRIQLLCQPRRSMNACRRPHRFGRSTMRGVNGWE